MNKSISKNIIFKFLLNTFNLVVPIIIGPYVLRVLGPDLMGTINFSQTIYGYFFIFAGFGVYQYGLREISRFRDDKKKLSQVYTSLFILTFITNILTIISYVIFIQFNYSGTEIYVVCMILTFNLLANIFYTEWVNEGLENYDFITIKTIIIRIVYVIFLFILVRSANNLKEYMILLVLSTFLNNIASYIYIRKRIPFDFSELKLLKHIKPMFLVVILSNANVLYTQLDRYFIGEYINMDSVAYYTIAQNISNIINSLLLTVIYVTIPRMSNYIANESETEYKKLLDRISKIYLIILFPASIGMFVLAKEIILIYGGSEYMLASSMMKVFSLYIITLGYETILSNQVMYVKGKEKEQVEFIFIGGIFNLISNLILIRTGHFNGTTAIFTTMLANILVIILEHLYINYVMKLNFNIFSFDKIKYLIISLIFLPTTYILRYSISNVVLFTLLTILINSIIYFLILFYTKDKNFLEIVNKVINFKNKSN
ncbi:TPA: oligosaccharide flippase family protein [Clostridium perfringens]|uniref:oligosaccharide flippase family protein n=1 Tax=Clostridium perfringens TaxID=1502 RepID=UPI000E19FE4B|nr:oligosaccharide flippase family protein [Clostridium perfringens]UBK74370.1 oligosaccharide flippase family protein [Clostridium perfringens]SUY37035.1 polysaccharide transporter protein [Clostridium perfringens]HAT4143126.1 oligosaccharide flippase family protein [Clostridium perfringens]HAT4146413.1 oligosaccharide flippase family protein [Clostridium perfringens]HBI6983765.1 oligosaccharide flippase family protein [Clostridium perfringens]